MSDSEENSDYENGNVDETEYTDETENVDVKKEEEGVSASENETNETENTDDTENAGVKKEEEEMDPQKPLSLDMMPECLSILQQIGKGWSVAYHRLDARDRALTDISMLNAHIHLRYIDLSGNFLRDLSPLASLNCLCVLNADNNKITSIKLGDKPYLQHLSLNNNRIKRLDGINYPWLSKLCLNNNQISEISGIDCEKMNCLEYLDLNSNKLYSTKNITFPKLSILNLTANQITRLDDLHHLKQLLTLDLSENKLEWLDGFSESMLNLQDINISNCLISKISEIKKLSVLPALSTLSLEKNPIMAEEDIKIEVLMHIKKLRILDEIEITEDEIKEAEARVTELNSQHELVKDAEQEEVIEDEMEE